MDRAEKSSTVDKDPYTRPDGMTRLQFTTERLLLTQISQPTSTAVSFLRIRSSFPPNCCAVDSKPPFYTETSATCSMTSLLIWPHFLVALVLWPHVLVVL